MNSIFAKNPKRENGDLPADTVIHAGTTFDGHMEVKGSLRIEGRLTGTLVVHGLLLVGPRAEIKADVIAHEARVSGTIRGPLKSRESVELLPGSRLEGDVYTKCFRIEDGAFFQGNCFMGEAWVEEILSR